MSNISKWNEELIYWNVLCTYTDSNGKLHKYFYPANNRSYEGSLEDAKRAVTWSDHPTYEAKVVGIRFL